MPKAPSSKEPHRAVPAPTTWEAQMTSGGLAQTIEEGRDELTPEEARAYAEEQTQKYFSMSFDQFVRSAEAGTLPEDEPMVVHLALLTGARLQTC